MSIAKIYLRQYSNVINVLVKNNDDALGESNELLKQNIKELNDENIMGLQWGMGDPVYFSHKFAKHFSYYLRNTPKLSDPQKGLHSFRNLVTDLQYRVLLMESKPKAILYKRYNVSSKIRAFVT